MNLGPESLGLSIVAILSLLDQTQRHDQHTPWLGGDSHYPRGSVDRSRVAPLGIAREQKSTVPELTLERGRAQIERCIETLCG